MRAKYEILESGNDRVVLKDVGGDGYATVTNAAEWVIEELFVNGVLKNGQRLFYWDTDGNLDELLVLNGHFDGFRPARSTVEDYHNKEKTKQGTPNGG